MQHRKLIACAALLALSCSTSSRGQTPTDITTAPSRSARAQVQNVPVALTWNYYPQPKTLVLHLTNNSGKDITAFSIAGKKTYTDGRSNDLHQVYNILSRLVEIQTAKDQNLAARRDRKSGNGIFLAGTTRDEVLPEPRDTNDISNVEAVVDVVFYSDGTFDEQNTDTFKVMLAGRQRQLLIDKEVIQAIDHALANQADDHPGAAALTELTKNAVEQTVKYSRYQEGAQYDPEKGQQYLLQMAIGNLQYNLQREQKATTERDRLTDYRGYQSEVVEVLTPQCHLEISPSQYGK
ncbi:MAG: hypothetical protein WA765_11775 [Candidatus Acidiferrum sp.]